MQSFVTFRLLLIFLFLPAFSHNAAAQTTEILEEKLAFAARMCDAESLKQLLAKKVSPNSRDRFNQPAVLLAFRCDRLRGSEREEKIWEIVKLLVEAGADVNVRNEFGVTPHLAAEIFDHVFQSNIRLVGAESKPRMQDYLAAKGAVPNVRDIHGRNGFQHFHNTDTGETAGEQLWRHTLEKSGELTLDADYQIASAQEKVRAANQFRFGRYNASLAMAAVYYDDLNLAKAVGMTLSNVTDDVDDEGENVYFYAVRSDNPFRFRFLLGREVFPEKSKLSDEEAQAKYEKINRANLKKTNKNGLTPLELSYQTDSILFQGFAYERLENPNETDREGMTPLFRALRNRNYPLIAALLSLDKINPNLPDKAGVAPLIYAARENSSELVALLVYGIKNPTAPRGKDVLKIVAPNINLPDADGKTALMIAAENGNSEIVKILLRNGANVYLKSKTGETALNLARKNNRSAVFYRLASLMKTPNAPPVQGITKNADASKNPTPLMIAAQNGDLTSLHKLLKSGAKIDETDADGKTALFYAILNDEIYAVRALLAAKANADHEAGGFATPLMAAARFKRDQMIPLLLKAGAKINAQDKFGKTALVWAATEANIETVSELLKGNPNLHVKDDKGETALVQTIKKGAFDAKEIAAALLKNGANPNDTDERQNNTIRIAVLTRQDNLFVLLLKAGANPFQKGEFGFDTFTALTEIHTPTIEEAKRLYNLIYDSTLPKYLPKHEK